MSNEQSERGNTTTPVQPITINVSCGECGNQGVTLDAIADLIETIEERAVERHAELVELIHGIIDSEGDKEKMRALKAQLDAKATELKGAIPAQST